MAMGQTNRPKRRNKQQAPPSTTPSQTLTQAAVGAATATTTHLGNAHRCISTIDHLQRNERPTSFVYPTPKHAAALLLFVRSAP